MRNSKNVYSHSWRLAENYGTFTLSYKQDKIRSIIALSDLLYLIFEK